MGIRSPRLHRKSSGVFFIGMRPDPVNFASAADAPNRPNETELRRPLRTKKHSTRISWEAVAVDASGTIRPLCHAARKGASRPPTKTRADNSRFVSSTPAAVGKEKERLKILSSDSSTAIHPLLIGRNDEALAVMEGLRLRGIRVPAIRPPTVPEGTARLRIARSAAPTKADIDLLIDAVTALAAAAR